MTQKTPLFRKTGLFFFLALSAASFAQDTFYIKVHFLYGSKPAREYRDSEDPWFGGKWGGHVGIEIDSNRVIDFLPSGGFHVFPKDRERNSHFVMRSLESFWETFGKEAHEVKKLSITIPVTSEQKKQLDELAAQYISDTPYDYAFFGMRCAAAAYDVLGQTGVLRKKNQWGIILRYFYPKLLRKKMIRAARKNGWQITRGQGVETREWEQDPKKKR